MIRRHPKRPAHLYRSESIYFVTARTWAGAPLFSTDDRRLLVVDVLDRVAREACRSIFAWFIGENHYHVVLGRSTAHASLHPLMGAKSVTDAGMRFDVARFANRTHSAISTLLNRSDGTPGRKVFHQYWDRCVRSEGETYATFNYIHQNPVKHGLVSDLQQARLYRACSLHAFECRYGQEWVGECFARYPVVDYTPISEVPDE